MCRCANITFFECAGLTIFLAYYSSLGRNNLLFDEHLFAELLKIAVNDEIGYRFPLMLNKLFFAENNAQQIFNYIPRNVT